MNILSGASNGTGTAVQFKGAGNRHKESVLTLYVFGTWDGATAKLQVSPDNSNWLDVTGADAFTADDVVNINGHFHYMRGVVSGGGGSESITMEIR